MATTATVAAAPPPNCCGPTADLFCAWEGMSVAKASLLTGAMLDWGVEGFTIPFRGTSEDMRLHLPSIGVCAMGLRTVAPSVAPMFLNGVCSWRESGWPRALKF